MKWFIVFLILPHLKPACLEYLWPSIDAMFNIGKLISALVILYLYLLKKKLPSKPVWIFALLQGWRLLATYLQAPDQMRAALLSAASILAVMMLIDFFSDYAIPLINALMIDVEIMVYMNLATVLLYYPNGLYRNTFNTACYFLGQRNGFILYVLPAFVLALLYMQKVGGFIRPLALILAGSLSIVITWSATSICVLLVFGVMLWLSSTSLNEWITFPSIFAITTMADILISVFRIMDRVLLFGTFIESFLRKQITLTGRTILWDSFYQRFSNSPWIGYGKGAEAIVGSNLLTHNQWFQELLEAGIPALVLFIVFNISVGFKMNSHGRNKCSYIFLAAFSGLYVLFVAESYPNPFIYMLYPLAYHVDKIEAALASTKKIMRSKSRGHYVPNRKLPEKH